MLILVFLSSGNYYVVTQFKVGEFATKLSCAIGIIGLYEKEKCKDWFKSDGVQKKIPRQNILKDYKKIKVAGHKSLLLWDF